MHRAMQYSMASIDNSNTRVTFVSCHNGYCLINNRMVILPCSILDCKCYIYDTDLLHSYCLRLIV